MEIVTEKKIICSSNQKCDDTKELLSIKVEQFHKKMQKERNERLFKQTRDLIFLPPILNDDLEQSYNIGDDDEEIDYIRKEQERDQKELEELYNVFI